jgi:hypothetical protein
MSTHLGIIPFIASVGLDRDKERGFSRRLARVKSLF